MRFFACLKNTSIKLVDHQEYWWLFAKRIATNSKEKEEWIEEIFQKFLVNEIFQNFSVHEIFQKFFH